MLRSLITACAFLLAGVAGSVHAADTPPDVLARTTTQEVLAILKQDKDIRNGDLSKVYQLVEAKVLPNFDFNRMTQLAVGKNWPRATAQQKQALVAEFRNLLVRTYSASLGDHRQDLVNEGRKVKGLALRRFTPAFQKQFDHRNGPHHPKAKTVRKIAGRRELRLDCVLPKDGWLARSPP